ncbi:MAG TPA: glycoside hydrolase family 125 protein [Longimicrobiales bacterium]|nr:glycoside hydrolase family 125 protein [Longimicrobiales bacterium]
MNAGDELTGNDYVSIPIIHRDASMDAINVLHGASAGLIEWAGDASPLLQPKITFDGSVVDVQTARWQRLDRWIPVFMVSLPDGSTIQGTICAPGGYPPARGFTLRVEAENRGRTTRELRVDLDIEWTWSRLRIATARPLPGRNLIATDSAATALTLEADGGRGPALAISTSHPPEVNAAAGDDVPTPLAGASSIWAENGATLRARVTQSVQVKSNSRAGVVFNVGAGRERDGALAAATSLRKAGPDHWLRQARLELSHTLRSAQDHRWAEPLNRNLLFNRYYAVGRAIDDDRLYLLRSRSPLCPEPALFNEREALLWTLPALIIADPGIAREAMFRAFDLASERSGEHMRYVDGGAYDAAFVLDQFLLYAWAVDYYVTASGDASVLEDPLTRQILHETDGAAFMRLHPQHVLAATELLASGDTADYPYTTMANALLWRFCERLPNLQPTSGEAAEPPPRFQGAAGEVAAAVWQHCVSEVQGHPILASSANLEGQAAVYDDPALSLAMLPFFGFCTADDPVWRATMEFLRSPQYPLWRTGPLPGLAGRSGSARPRTSALCADLLTHQAADALDRLLRVQMPNGVAASEYDAETGAGTGPHHAALAGFVAWTLVHAAEPTETAPVRRRRRR